MELSKAERILIETWGPRIDKLSYSVRGISPDDVKQELLIQLVKCSRYYNPKFGASFSTYVYSAMQNRIRNMIKQEQRRYQNVGRGPSYDTTESSFHPTDPITYGKHPVGCDYTAEDNTWYERDGFAIPAPEVTPLSHLLPVTLTEKETDLIYRRYNGASTTEVKSAMNLTTTAYNALLRSCRQKCKVLKEDY